MRWDCRAICTPIFELKDNLQFIWDIQIQRQSIPEFLRCLTKMKIKLEWLSSTHQYVSRFRGSCPRFGCSISQSCPVFLLPDECFIHLKFRALLTSLVGLTLTALHPLLCADPRNATQLLGVGFIFRIISVSVLDLVRLAFSHLRCSAFSTQ
jgi:hypothetical protein